MYPFNQTRIARLSIIRHSPHSSIIRPLHTTPPIRLCSRHKRTIRTHKAQFRVEIRACLNTNDLRFRLRKRLRHHLNIAELKILARCIGVWNFLSYRAICSTSVWVVAGLTAFDNNTLRVCQIRQSNIIPTRIRDTAAIARLELIDRSRKILPPKILHHNTTIIRPSHRRAIPVLQLRLRVALVDICLRDEDGEGDVVGANVCPGDVAGEALAALPGFETRGVDAVDDGEVVEGDGGYVGEGGLVLAETADGHAVGLVADCAACAGRVSKEQGLRRRRDIKSYLEPRRCGIRTVQRRHRHH